MWKKTDAFRCSYVVRENNCKMDVVQKQRFGEEKFKFATA